MTQPVAHQGITHRKRDINFKPRHEATLNGALDRGPSLAETGLGIGWQGAGGPRIGGRGIRFIGAVEASAGR